MKDLLIPLGLLLFIAIFVSAVVITARRQNRAKAKVFKDFADRNGLSYLQEDDGKAQEFAREFDGIGQFSSSSLGKVIPKDVTAGILHGVESILFRHSTRYSGGFAREWFVAGVNGPRNQAKRCAIQFCRGDNDRSTIHLPDPVVKELRAGPFTLLVRAANPSEAGNMLDEGVLQQLAVLGGELSIRPEVQIRGHRLLAYPADRNATVDDIATLDELLWFAGKAINIRAKS